MKRAIAWLIAVAGMLPAAAIATPPQQYVLVDLATPYATFWAETRGLATPERVAAFKSRFNVLLPGFFTAQRVGWMSDAEYDAAIARSLENFPAIREKFAAATSAIAKLLAPAHESFTKSFPDLRPIGPIYIVHSLGEFDGGTRPVSGVNRVMFGADVIARLHDFPDERPFFHHELFHVYHAQFFEECEQAWCPLWMEGLAVLAAKRLNPAATDVELLLSSPRPIRPDVDRDRKQAVCAVSARLDSTAPADYATLFSNGQVPAELPPRFGYYVGYLVANEAAKKQSLIHLAHLDNAAARGVVNAALDRLASCNSFSP